MPSPYELITKKQRDGEHSPEELRAFIEGFMDGEIPDYQMTAWMMAVYFQGMTLDETVALTEAMINSGEKVRLNEDSHPAGDKHSTGGVGDKISLILAPLLAASGLSVPTITGRGLGFTGGTLDKLESIPGFRTALSIDEIREFTSRFGLAFGAQTEKIVPADRRMYALRDVTGTVRSLPLITSSILSKKVAEGIDAIVFDVKCGLGAFMETEEQAVELGGWLVQVAERFGLKAAALVTSMDEPLGMTVGNWIEVRESIESLHGDRSLRDIVRLTEALGGMLLHLAGLTETPKSGIEQISGAWEKGLGFEKFLRIAEAQGGDADVLISAEDPHKPGFTLPLLSDHDGFISRIHARETGFCALELGAGRLHAEDTIDPAAGILLAKKVGDSVRKGEEIARLLGRDESICRKVLPRFRAAVTVSEQAPKKPPLLRKVVTSGGVMDWMDYLEST